ncbi:MAG TPA: protein kinase, partial [Candidatus Dormibacteraeota bacterium]|nr:protein kinase [Candidatus Dormibacteraeota bacterium]
LQRLHLRILKQDPALELKGRPLRGYQLLEEVGRGAFGAVYRAVQPEVGRDVAVKVIDESYANDPNFIRRFEREAQLVARLEHPHIVPLYDYWRDPGGAYLVMRYMKGGNLAQLLRNRGRLQPREASRLMDDVASALSFAHRSSVVHRDVRPQNVLFDEEGNAFLSDFGIAKVLTGGKDLAAVSPGLAYYTAPEEIQGRTVSAATDVYSLGLLLFEVLAGRHAFADTPPPGLLERHLMGSIPSLETMRPELPQAIDAVIQRAAALDPTDRFDDVPSFAAALREAIQLEAVTVAMPVAVRNPYKGLHPFQEADAPDFFGREAMVERVLACLCESAPGSRFLAVVGPSGGGKSSLLRAGVLPALRKGAVPGSERWFVVDMHPGAHPFEELESALLTVAGGRPPTLLDVLLRDEHGLTRAAASVLPADRSELLVMIDQFEEVFTHVADEDRRAAFLDCVRGAVSDRDSRVRVVVTMRADFYDRPLLYRAFGDLLAERTLALTPHSVEDLERVITAPAAGVGVRVEPALVAEILTAVADQPVLPLLQYALTELLESRENGTLTLKAYHQLGGVVGALSRRADEICAGLDDRKREAARQLFLRLVTVSDDGLPETRRRVLRSELADLEQDPAGMDSVIDEFGAHRLLSFDRDPVTRGPTVEVAHEALLREWSRLRGWIDSAREDLGTHRRIAAAAGEWEGADRDPSFLLTGARLEQAEAWTGMSSIVLSASERRFVATSVARREVERQSERARKAREVALEARSHRRLRALVAVFAVAAVLTSALSAFALNQRGVVLQQARAATARELAAAALANIPIDPQRSLILALKAVSTTRAADGVVVPEAESVLHRAVVASRIEKTIPKAGTMFSWSRDTNTIAFAGLPDSKRIEIRDPAGASLRWWRAPDSVNDIRFLPGGRLATSDGTGAISIWDSATGELRSVLRGSPLPAYGLSASSDGRLLAGLWWDSSKKLSSALVWDLTNGRILRVINHLEGPAPSPAQGTALSPDGSRLAIALAGESVVEVYAVSTGRRELRLPAGTIFQINRLAWTSDGRRLATVGQEVVRVWEASGALAATLVGHASPVVDV